MTTELALVRGGVVALTQCRDGEVTLEAEFAAPPGSSVDVLILGSKVSVKVRACRRSNQTEPARFCIEGRFVNLSREQRAALPTK